MGRRYYSITVHYYINLIISKMVFFSVDLAEYIGKWQWRVNVKNQSNEGVASIAFVSCSSITFF